MIQAFGTGFLVLLLALWLVKGQGALWRHTVWQQAGRSIVETARRLGADVRARWTGWSVVQGSVRIDWTGGLSGLQTTVRYRGPSGRSKEVREGMLDADQVLGIRDQLVLAGTPSKAVGGAEPDA